MDEMPHTPESFIGELLETMQTVISDISEREAVLPDLAIVRELAEQMHEELELLL